MKTRPSSIKRWLVVKVKLLEAFNGIAYGTVIERTFQVSSKDTPNVDKYLFINDIEEQVNKMFKEAINDTKKD
mgnify:FL=1